MEAKYERGHKLYNDKAETEESVLFLPQLRGKRM